MRPGTLRALILIATMVLMAFTLPRFGPPNDFTPAAASPHALDEIPLPAAGIDPAAAQPAVSSALPALDTFIAQVSTGDRNTVTGVYVSDLLAFRVVQQPADDIFFIDKAADAATQYQLAASAGTIGLLAHNYSGGETFALLDPGEIVWLVFGDGSTRAYQIEQVRHYQAIDSDDPYGNLVDLDTGEVLDSSTVFERNYSGGRLVLQTCIEHDGEWSWGRLFVLASPVEE